MNLSGLLWCLQDVPAYQTLRAQLAVPPDAQGPERAPLGLMAAARPYLAAALACDLARPVVLLAARSEHARQWVEQARTWAAERAAVHLLADPDALPYERIPWSRETKQARLAALTALADAHPPILVVASARALMQKTLPPRELRLSLRTLRRGQIMNVGALLTHWLGLGYTPAAVTEEPGTFSRRGGILDIWPPNLPYPARLELFGDELESIRLFDPATQRTQEQVQALTIGPASEAFPKHGPLAAERLAAWDLGPCHPAARQDFEEERERLRREEAFRGSEFYLPYLWSQPASLLDYLPSDGLLLMDEGGDFASEVANLEAQAAQLEHDLRAAGELPIGALSPFFGWEALKRRIQERRPLILGYSDLEGRPVPQASDLSRVFAPGPRLGGQLRRIVAELEERRQAGQRIVLVTRQAPRLADLLAEAGHPATFIGHVAQLPPPASVTIVQGVLPEGWLLEKEAPKEDALSAPSAQQPLLSLLTDAELFGWTKPQPRRAARPRPVAPETFFADVQPGDYVVHLEHGIGLFRGLVRLTTDGMEREYLQVDYAQGDRLYVPIHQADRLSRYIGATDAPPVLNRLGTADWNVVKSRAKRAVADIAEELLQLYAERETVTGHAFSPDTPWQQELEASFPYVETEDQLAAVAEVKRDMEQPRPMDRLICGDVGYGKTEVALRAAFKAINDGKQVAVLVPTTVLAQQHFQTFSERLKPFPITVEMLSRFRSKAEQQQVLEGLKSGRVDLVVGTHRLIQKDVQFKDLGLVIIDEEQRFGVAHKERLKQLRKEVDVLTLTATPIPRTLHMSLTGVRDLSTINTPPEERLPIKTTLAEFDETLIRQAILREVDRGGQVFFVHNRVQGIASLAQRLRRIVPEVTIAVAHGQMPERELEKVMLRFANGEIDVLVCTAIIESGLDIPNANTIIINHADKFGLAQLYQLRGRVGRSAVRAYCYLLYSPGQSLSPTARRRLESILEASELGAGFRIAMSDLEIRGAGELLGARQHGHIAAIGFDLYCRLLAQAVQELRQRRTAPANGRASRPPEETPDPLAPAVTLELPLPAFIPETYIPEEALRLQLYRRMAALTTIQQVAEMSQELQDRFGPPPEPVRNLLYVLQVKALAIRAKVNAIGREDDQLALRSDALEAMDRAQLQQRLGPRARVGRRQVLLPFSEGTDWQKELLRVLEIWGRVA